MQNYTKKGHYSETSDSLTKKRERARFPKAVLQDMVEILRAELPHVFADTTVDQLKAIIQNYLARPGQKY